MLKIQWGFLPVMCWVMNWIPVVTVAELLYAEKKNKTMNPINVTVVSLMWPCGAVSDVKHEHDLSKEVSLLPFWVFFFNPLIFFAWRIHLFVTWNGISPLWTMKTGGFKREYVSVWACMQVTSVDSQGDPNSFMWTPLTLFYYEKIAEPCPLLCVQVHFNNLLCFINLLEYN